MNKLLEFKKIFDKYDGVITTSEFIAEGYHHDNLKKLVDKGIIRRIKRGYYEWQHEQLVSDVVIIKKLFPDAVVYLNSALFIYGYIDRTPYEWHLAVDRNSAKKRFNIGYPKIKPYYISEDYMKLGITDTNYEGNKIKIFDRDRTICDLIRYSNRIDNEMVSQGIKSYIDDHNKNISNLMNYAKKLNVESKVKTMVGMWL